MSECQLNLARHKQGVAEFAKLIPRLLQRPLRIVGMLFVARQGNCGTDALLVGEREDHTLIALSQHHIDPDAAIRARLLQHLAEGLIVVAVDFGAHLQPRHTL